MIRTIRSLSTTHRRLSNVHFSENFDGSVPQKPLLKNFRTAFINFFLLLSAVFMVCNTVWYRLEYDHVKKDLEAESSRLEAQLESAMANAKDDLEKKSFLSKLMFWK